MYASVLELCLVVTTTCAIVVHEDRHEKFPDCVSYMEKIVDDKDLLRFLAYKNLTTEFGSEFTYKSYCISEKELKDFISSKKPKDYIDT